MPHSVLESFDPFATHPFTNNSGIVPQPPQPSQYPIPIPSPRRSQIPQFPQSSPSTSASPSSPTRVSPQSPPPLKAPQPQRHVASNSPPKTSRPIFVPFRQETSSPDLVLKKKSPSKRDTASQVHRS